MRPKARALVQLWALKPALIGGIIGLAVAVGIASCALRTRELPVQTRPANPAIRVVSEPVSEAPSPSPVGTFTYAGGLVLTSPDTSRFHGLSDLAVAPDGQVVAVSDEGDLVKGRITLDRSGQLAGITDVTLAPLTGLDGKPLSGAKTDSDSEGLALWPNGDLMVSFERNHRIWLYPAKGGPPRAVPFPATDFPDNDGMEALALDPVAGRDAYLAGREDTRQTWTCRLAGGCTPFLRPGLDNEGKLVAARALPKDRWAFLLRDFSPMAGATIRILITDRAGTRLDLHTITRPATVDNFEGIAAVPRNDGSIRFYIISDDNFSPVQRTLLMAFDWRPAKGQ